MRTLRNSCPETAFAAAAAAVTDSSPRIRRAGFVVCREYLNVGTLAVAAPVREAGGSVVAAVSTVVPVEQDPAPLLPALVAAARGISRGLGSGGFR